MPSAFLDRRCWGREDEIVYSFPLHRLRPRVSGKIQGNRRFTWVMQYVPMFRRAPARRIKLPDSPPIIPECKENTLSPPGGGEVIMGGMLGEWRSYFQGCEIDAPPYQTSML